MELCIKTGVSEVSDFHEFRSKHIHNVIIVLFNGS